VKPKYNTKWYFYKGSKKGFWGPGGGKVYPHGLRAKVYPLDFGGKGGEKRVKRRFKGYFITAYFVKYPFSFGGGKGRDWF
jgi:hypothetical protein